MPAELVIQTIYECFQGQPFDLALKFYDANGDLADAVDPVLALYNPSTEQVIKFTSGQLTRNSTGDYSRDLALPEPGDWVAHLYDNATLGASQPAIISVKDNPAYGR